MAKIVQLARCYLDDQDVEDILMNPRISERSLIRLAQSRGIFVNPKESRESLVRYLSRMPLDWASLQELSAQLDKPEREQKRAVTRVQLDPGIPAIEAALEAIKVERGGSRREEFKIERIDGGFIFRGDYLSIDHSKSKAFQRQRNEFAVEVEISDGKTTIQFTHDDRAREVVDELIAKLKGPAGSEIEEAIILTGIKDPALRTDFFLKLRRLMTGFRPLDVLDIKVDCRTEADDEIEEDDDQDEEAKDERKEAEVKSMVKSAALHGQGLLTSELYQTLRESGYFVHRIIWTSIDNAGDGRLMEFEAGFENPILATKFNYDLKKASPNEKDKKDGLTQLEVTNRQRKAVRKQLVQAAYKALEEINKSVKGAEEQL
jgi:hypothetical protein